jgi:glutaredoxin
MFKIISKDDCPWCDKAKNLLEEKGVPFRDFHYKEHPMLVLLMKRASLNTVPQIWVETPAGNTYIGGYADLENWLELFEVNQND